MKNAQGALDLRKWECAIPGKDRTIWEGGVFKLEVTFPEGKNKSRSQIFLAAMLTTLFSHRVPYQASQVYVNAHLTFCS